MRRRGNDGDELRAVDGQGATEPDTRRHRSQSGATVRNAIAILKDDGVRPVTGSDVHFKVQSQSSSAWYDVIVDLDDGIRNCSCPQHMRLRSTGIINAGCKHVRAAELWLVREYAGAAIATLGRSDHVRKHPKYNQARSRLPRGTAELVRALVSSVTPEEIIPRRCRRGRRPRTSREVYANLLIGAASAKASREAVDPAIFAALGFAGKPMSTASRLAAMKDERVRDGLRSLVFRTGLATGPAKNFAQDSHHYRTPYSKIYFETRDGEEVVVLRAMRCKLHIVIDTETQLIVSVYVSDPYVPDIKFFDIQVDDVWALCGNIDTWHADNAYNSAESLARIASLGGDPSYIDFSVEDKPNGNPIWDMALARYRRRQSENGPHPRSLVESVNNALRMHNHKVRARQVLTRECELLARVVIYNIRRAAFLHITEGRPIEYADERAMAALREDKVGASIDELAA
jgi:hypothetical protein